jgi:Tol biopolymer transport system component
MFVATALSGGPAVAASPATSPAPTPPVSASPIADSTPAPRWTTGPQLPPFASLPTAPISGLPSHGRIAFNVEWGEDGDQYKNVLTIEPDGTDLRQLTDLAPGNACCPAWTPSGELIYSLSTADSSANHLTVMDGSGGSQQTLTTGAFYDDNPQVSTDGKLVVFDRHTFTSNSNVMLMNADGSDLHPLTHPDPTDGDGDWMADVSPDGQHVVFIHNGDIYTVGIDGADLKLVLHGDGYARAPRWSPDGTRVLFDFDEGRVNVLDLATGNVAEIAGGADASWSPDSSLIAYRTYLDGTHYLSLVVAQADGSNPQVIWHTPEQTDIFIAWTDWGTAD